jgi:hypothetical protein
MWERIRLKISLVIMELILGQLNALYVRRGLSQNQFLIELNGKHLNCR